MGYFSILACDLEHEGHKESHAGKFYNRFN